MAFHCILVVSNLLNFQSDSADISLSAFVVFSFFVSEKSELIFSRNFETINGQVFFGPYNNMYEETLEQITNECDDRNTRFHKYARTVILRLQTKTAPRKNGADTKIAPIRKQRGRHFSGNRTVAVEQNGDIENTTALFELLPLTKARQHVGRGCYRSALFSYRRCFRTALFSSEAHQKYSGRIMRRSGDL